MKNNLIFSLFLRGIIIFLLSCNSGAEKYDHIRNFKNYYAAIEEDTEDRWNYTTDTVKLWFDKKKGAPILQVKGQGSTGKWQEWDSVMNSSSRYDSLWYDKNEGAVRGIFYENNDFYELIGKSPTKTLRTYWINSNNKISEILIYWIPEENTTTSQHLEPVLYWALQNDSTEITELYSNGNISPSKGNALRWKRLLIKYNKSQGAN